MELATHSPCLTEVDATPNVLIDFIPIVTSTIKQDRVKHPFGQRC